MFGAMPAFAGTPNGVSPALRQSAARAAPGERVAAWVFFADKGGDTNRRLADASAGLTEHARARRIRNHWTGRLVDMRDVPVDPAYVAAVRRQGAHIRYASRWLNAVSVDVAPEAVDKVASLAFVRGLDAVRTGTAPLPPEPTALVSRTPRTRSLTSLDYGSSFTQNNLIHVPALHDLGYNGHGVIICMMDAGVNELNHIVFQNIHILVTRDFVNGDSIVSDQPGQMGSGNHGTYTLSVIGGFAPGQLIGPAWGATYVLAKTENTDWERHIEEDAWVAGAEWADSIGVDIISSSVGYSFGFTNGETGYTWQDMDGNTAIITIGADIAASRGILIVQSAGNDGSVSLPANTLIAPADGDSVLCVGAVDALGVRASFSSVGPTADGRTKPDVMAMGLGVTIASAFDSTTFYSNSGTSFSAPLTAGAAALILEARPTASNAEIMQALRTTASQAGSPDRFNGWGIVDAEAAANYLSTGIARHPGSAGIALYAPHPNPFNPSTTIEFATSSSRYVVLTVYDVRGARVATLVAGNVTPGRHTVQWNGTDDHGQSLASGVYLCRLSAGDAHETRKVVLLK